MIGGEFIKYADNHAKDYQYPFNALDSFLSTTDILLVNFEGPIFCKDFCNHKRPDTTTLLSNHYTICNFLKKYNICVLNLANNHIMDYGEECLRNTLKTFRRHGLFYIGAGNNLAEASKELILNIKGRLVAFLSFTSNEQNVNSVIANSQNAGSPSFLEIDQVIARIKRIRKKVDIICVSLHWGYENFRFPSNEQVNMARMLVDAGAKYVIGHHPHVIQGVENYKGSLILYSMGNFFMPSFRFTSGRLKTQQRDEKEFMLILSDIDKKEKIKYRILGGYINKKYELITYNNYYKNNFHAKISRLSNVILSEQYEKFWNIYRIRRESEINIILLINAFKKLFKIRKKDLKTINLNDAKRQLERLKKILFGNKL